MTRRRPNSWQPARVLVLIAHAAGVDAAKNLVRHFAGRRLYVPRQRMPDNHEIVVGIGRAGAEALRDEFGGEEIIVPMGRDLQLDIAAAAVENATGSKRYAISKALGVSYTTAKRLLRKLRSDVPNAPQSPAQRRRSDPRQIDIEDLLAR